jgi:hypothetical protein
MRLGGPHSPSGEFGKQEQKILTLFSVPKMLYKHLAKFKRLFY